MSLPTDLSVLVWRYWSYWWEETLKWNNWAVWWLFFSLFFFMFCYLPRWWETVAGWRPLHSHADSNTPHLDDQSWKVFSQGTYITAMEFITKPLVCVFVCVCGPVCTVAAWGVFFSNMAAWNKCHTVWRSFALRYTWFKGHDICYLVTCWEGKWNIHSDILPTELEHIHHQQQVKIFTLKNFTPSDSPHTYESYSFLENIVIIQHLMPYNYAPWGSLLPGSILMFV